MGVKYDAWDAPNTLIILMDHSTFGSKLPKSQMTHACANDVITEFDAMKNFSYIIFSMAYFLMVINFFGLEFFRSALFRILIWNLILQQQSIPIRLSDVIFFTHFWQGVKTYFVICPNGKQLGLKADLNSLDPFVGVPGFNFNPCG